MNKKVLGIALGVGVVVAIIVACVCMLPKSSASKNIEGNLEDLMSKLYNGISPDDMPALATNPVTQENIEYYLGTSDIQYKEGLASEPLMSSIAHSVVLLRLNSADDANAVKEKIRNNVNPRKWICVEVEQKDVKIESSGDLVVLIMVNELSDKILENFNNL